MANILPENSLSRASIIAISALCGERSAVRSLRATLRPDTLDRQGPQGRSRPRYFMSEQNCKFSLVLNHKIVREGDQKTTKRPR
mmetsp:Transcript_106/g.204  ORF Transcript_106/g.204 Transcript_106/m.204 type:complete len:84 (+) Transcript_106:173-424(+)